MDFLDSYEPLLKAFWYIALPVSVFFLLQTIATFVGLSGAESDVDGDAMDGDMPFEVFTLRNLINFLLGFGWTGVSFYEIIENKIVLVGLAVLVGVLFVGVFFVLIKQIMKLSEDNTFKVENTINQIAEVYLTIPERKTGKGKIHLSVKGTFHELDAITNSSEKLLSGTAVKVVAVENHLLLVEKN